MSETQAKDSKAGGLELVGELLTLAEITQTALVASELLSRQAPDEIKVRVRTPAEAPRRPAPPFAETRSSIPAARSPSASPPAPTVASPPRPLDPHTPSGAPPGHGVATSAPRPPLDGLEGLGLPPLDELSGTFCSPAQHTGMASGKEGPLSQSAQPLPPRAPLSALASPPPFPVESPQTSAPPTPAPHPAGLGLNTGGGRTPAGNTSAQPLRTPASKSSPPARTPTRAPTPPPTVEEGGNWSLGGLMANSVVELPWQQEENGPGLPLSALPSAGAELVTPSEGTRAPRPSRPASNRAELPGGLPVKALQAASPRTMIQPLPPPVADPSPEVEMLARLAQAEDPHEAGEDAAEQVSGSTVHFQVATGTLSVAQLQAQAQALDAHAQALPPVHEGVEGEDAPPPVPAPVLHDLFNAVSAQHRISRAGAGTANVPLTVEKPHTDALSRESASGRSEVGATAPVTPETIPNTTAKTSRSASAPPAPHGPTTAAVLRAGAEGQDKFEPTPHPLDDDDDDSDPSLIFAGGTLLPLAAFETGSRTSSPTPAGEENGGSSPQKVAKTTGMAGAVGSSVRTKAPAESAPSVTGTKLTQPTLTMAVPPPLGLEDLPPNPPLLNLSEIGEGEGDSISAALSNSTRTTAPRLEKGNSVSLPPWESTAHGTAEKSSPGAEGGTSPSTSSGEGTRARPLRATSVTKANTSLSKEELQQMAREALARQKEAPEDEKTLPTSVQSSRWETVKVQWQAHQARLRQHTQALVAGLCLLSVGFAGGFMSAQADQSLPAPQPSPCQQPVAAQENVLGRAGLRQLPAPSPVAPALRGEAAGLGAGMGSQALSPGMPSYPAPSSPSSSGLALGDPLALPKAAAAPPLDATALADRRTLLNSTINLGKESFRNGEFLQTEQYFRQALDLATELGDEKQRQWLRWQVGRVWMQLGEEQMKDVILSAPDCQKAHDYFQRAWAIGFTGERNAENLQRAALCKSASGSP
ncbi:MAG: hypothetical protein ACKO6N_01880 [Myxococcota bacterium]